MKEFLKEVLRGFLEVPNDVINLFKGKFMSEKTQSAKLPDFSELTKKANEPKVTVKGAAADGNEYVPPVVPKLPTFAELQALKEAQAVAEKEAMRKGKDGKVLPDFAELKRIQAEQDKAKRAAEKAAKEAAKAGQPKKEKTKLGKYVKEAMPLDQFRALPAIAKEKFEAVFYRYLRFNDANNNFSEGPKGGGALLIGLYPEVPRSEGRRFKVSFSTCSRHDHFVFDKARKLCQDRFIGGLTVVVDGYDRNMSTIETMEVIADKILNATLFPANPFPAERSKNITNQHLRLLLETIQVHLNGGLPLVVQPD